MPRFLLHGKTAVPVTMEREVARVLKLAEKVKLGGWSACRVTADVEKVAERKSRSCEPGNQVTFHLMFNPAQVTFLLPRSTTILCLIQLRNAE